MIKTREEVEKEFRSELELLFLRWGAWMNAEDHYQGYPECGEDIRMTVYIGARYTPNGEIIQEDAEINLGQYFQ